MPKIKKQQRRKVYHRNINRKKLNRKQHKKINRTIQCKPVKEAWDEKKSVKVNMRQMGLVFDPNANIKRRNTVEEKRRQLSVLENEQISVLKEKSKKAPKAFVAQELENEAKAPRERCFQLPKGQVEYITYLLDKYGMDFKAMARDRRNFNQETWKQIRRKIKTFRKVPEQYNAYLTERGLLDKNYDEDLDKAFESDDSD